MKRKMMGLLAAVSMLGGVAWAQDNYSTGGQDVEQKGEVGTGGSGSNESNLPGGVNQDCFGPDAVNNPACDVETGPGTGGSGSTGTSGGTTGTTGGLDDNDAASDIYRTPTGGDLGTGGAGSGSDSIPAEQDSSGDIDLNGGGTGGSGSQQAQPSKDGKATGGSGSESKDLSKSDVNIYGPSSADDSQDMSSTDGKKKQKKSDASKDKSSEGTGGSGSATEQESETFKRDAQDRTPTTRPENPKDRGTGSTMPEEPGTY